MTPYNHEADKQLIGFGVVQRIFFTLEQEIMVLLHGFIKKGQKTPKKELDLARKRLAQVKGRK